MVFTTTTLFPSSGRFRTHPVQAGAGRAVALLIAFCAVGTAQTCLPNCIPNLLLDEVWRVAPYSKGYMSTSLLSELNEFLSSSQGQIWYMSKSQATGTAALYRHYNSSTGDHLDSLSQTVSGYTTDGIIAWPWTSATAFPANMAQVVVAWNGEYHASLRPDESIAGYNNLTDLGVYGFERYNFNQIDLLTLSGGGITAVSNKVAGGVVWTWSWNGKAFVNSANTASYGQEMQSALFFSPSGHPEQNPTEAGDSYSGPSYPTELSHGSPAMAFFNSGNMQVTNSVPLDFTPGNWAGGEASPVLYPGMLMGKQLTLDYDGLGPVAGYVTTLTMPQSLSPVTWQIPTVYLPDSFDQFYIYDAKGGAGANVTSEIGNSCPTSVYSYTPVSGYGGVIISDSTGDYAMGIYGVATALGGPVSYFNLSNWSSCGSVTNLGAVYDGSVSSGNSSVTTWAINGTVSQVESLMSQMVTKSNAVSANPIQIVVPAGQTDGVTTISWNAPGYTETEIHVGSPTGTLFVETPGPSGQAVTGDWVSNGLTFYLVSNGNGVSLGSVTVSVVQQ